MAEDEEGAIDPALPAEEEDVRDSRPFWQRRYGKNIDDTHNSKTATIVKAV